MKIAYSKVHSITTAAVFYPRWAILLTATITDSAGRTNSHSESITVTNTPPDAPTVTATPSRTVQDGKFFVDIKAMSLILMGMQDLGIRWVSADGYYIPGTHTIRVGQRTLQERFLGQRKLYHHSSAPTVTLTATYQNR